MRISDDLRLSSVLYIGETELEEHDYETEEEQVYDEVAARLVHRLSSHGLPHVSKLHLSNP